jgi:tRNA dimethylallyltransferase
MKADCYISFEMHKKRVISIVGPTASGKTSLSIAVAQACNGEVISADSRQVYTGLDIGSGKVKNEEMGGIPHHLLSIVEPMTTYTGVDFVRDATSAISNIIENNRVPIIVGGTFFYTELLRGTMSAAPVPINQTLREELEKLSDEDLFKKIEAADQARAKTIDSKNRRRMIRSLEIIDTLGFVPAVEATESDYDWLTIGISVPKETLHQNIHTRLLERFDVGMVEEVNRLLRQDVTHERLEALGLEYRYISRHLRGLLTYEEMVTELETKIRQFAKRQMTWLKRDKTIEWFNKAEQEKVIERVKGFLSES